MSLFVPSRRWSAERQPAQEQDRRRQALAVLTGARAVVARGWLQGAWYVLEAHDGRRRVIGTGSLTPRRHGTVEQACLVGAVVEGARRYSSERGAGGPALDELWCAWREAQGRPVDVSRRAPSPVVRQLRALELIHWNDAPERTQAEVVALLDRAAARLAREASSVNPVDAPLVG